MLAKISGLVGALLEFLLSVLAKISIRLGCGECLVRWKTQQQWRCFRPASHFPSFPSHSFCSASLAAVVSLAVLAFLLFLISALLSLVFESSFERVFELKHAFKFENVFRETSKDNSPLYHTIILV